MLIFRIIYNNLRGIGLPAGFNLQRHDMALGFGIPVGLNTILIRSFVMKQILTFFVIALLVSGCQSTNQPGDSSPPNVRDLTRPKSPPHLVQRGDPNRLQKALVIGNSEYDYSRLHNPVNDAIAMTDTLVNMGFYVTRATNLNHQKMKDAVQAFEKSLSDTQVDVALFFFSGHGVQIKGQNFLLPVDNKDIRGEADLKRNAVLAQNVLAGMKKANKGMNIFVLEASRNNPYRGSEKNTVRGLARIVPPIGTLIAFAAAPGQPALDSEGLNGLYTTHLLKALKNAQHKRIEDVFMEIRNPVVAESGGGQEPWYQASLKEPFCFGGCR
jgi:hypothetical protein